MAELRFGIDSAPSDLRASATRLGERDGRPCWCGDQVALAVVAANPATIELDLGPGRWLLSVGSYFDGPRASGDVHHTLELDVA